VSRSWPAWSSASGWVAALALGCGPVGDSGEIGSSSSSSSTGASAVTEEGSSTGAPAASSSSSDGADGSSTAPDPGGYEDDDGGTGCTFTCPDPLPPAPPPGDGDWCGLDCPEGEKCMPWANDGGSMWNSFRCTPIDDDPDAPGEPCMVEGSDTSGIDSCVEDAICWQVDPATNEGVCHAACGSGFVCADGFECLLFDAGVPLCVQSCDALAPDCPAGLACAFLGGGLVCQAVPGAVPLDQPCGPAIPCEPGTLCSFDPAVSCGNELGMGCCAAPCDVNDPMACMGPEVCVPWFPLRPPPELADLGVCAAP
jgi:hypothetical protein